MAKFRKKPIVIEAVQWTGANLSEIVSFAKSPKATVFIASKELSIETLEGTMVATKGDWIIRGVEGEIYPCNPNIFEQTYEPAD